MSRRCLRRLVFVAVAVLGIVAARAEITLGSLLDEMVDADRLARWPDPAYTCRQASSYDRATVAPDQPGWFANSDQNQFIRTETIRGRTEKVMLDADGPGCLVRFWLTTDRNKRGWLRIYLDGAAEPTLTFPAYDLLSGELGVGEPLAQPHPGYHPDSNGGNNLYLPIPYARHCKVTWEEAGESARYYQINYRTYAAGTVVRSFTRAQLEAARPRIAAVNRLLLSPPDDPPGRAVTLGFGLAPGAADQVELPPGPAAVRRLELSVPRGDPGTIERRLRSLVLRMECDGEPTVWCPVSDFFGSGVGLNAVAGWERTVTTNGLLICRWVMPYQRGARIGLLNLGDQPVSYALRATVGAWTWDARSLHFHAAWHHEAGLRTPPARDWNFVALEGRGVYVGDTLALYNPVATWYGEGDEKIRVDGEAFPSHVGTGTEDYYGYSYAPQPVHLTPFGGEPRLDQRMTQGHSTSTRSRLLDAIPFRRSLRFDIELIAWKPTTLTYAATTYWYGAPGIRSNVAPQPEAAGAPVPTLADAMAGTAPGHRLGAVECETMTVVDRSAGMVVGPQEMDAFGGERWSGGQQLLGQPVRAGDFLELSWPATNAAPVRLVLQATQAPDYGTLRFRVNGQAVAAGLDGYAETVQPAAPLALGVFAPKDGRFVLRVELTGTNPKATGVRYLFGLDCVVVTPAESDGAAAPAAGAQPTVR